MRLSRRDFLAAAPFAVFAPAYAQSVSEAPLSGAKVQADLKLLAAAYGSLHPGLDRYLGREGFARLVAKESDRLGGRGCTIGELFLSLARLTAAVRCGHSFPNPANQKRAVRTALFEARDRLPFRFVWIDGKMVVTSGWGASSPIPRGTVIERLDGMKPAALLARLLPLARADGANNAKRRALLQLDSFERYHAFDVYRPMIAATQPGYVRVRFDGKEIELPATTEEEREAASAAADRGGWSFAFTDGIGLLTMPTWALYNSKWDWKGYLDGCFEQLTANRASGLVIDLRANEGGLEIGNAILARLAERPLELPQYERRVRYRRVPEALRPHLDTWDRSFDDWGEEARPTQAADWFSLVRGRDDEAGARIEPAGTRFAGKCAVLIGPTCSSATFQFAEAVRLSRVATLVGEPTGGNLRGINGGAYYFLQLPESGLEVDLPLIGYFPPGRRPNSGVRPNVHVSRTAADIAHGRDPAMQAARRIVG